MFATFERLIKTLNFANLIAPGVEDMVAGRTKPLEQFIEEFESAKKIPRSSKVNLPSTTV